VLWSSAATTARVADATPAPVTITIKLGRAGPGTFAISGAPTDSGRVQLTRKASRGRLATTFRLVGTYGTLVVNSSQRCAARTGTWTVVSGTGAYAGAAGGGSARGRVACRRRSTLVLAGQVTTPQLGMLPSYAKPALSLATDTGGIATEDSADFNGDGFIDVVIMRHNWPGLVTYTPLILLNALQTISVVRERAAASGDSPPSATRGTRRPRPVRASGSSGSAPGTGSPRVSRRCERAA
jgi:hypothetical protein